MANSNVPEHAVVSLLTADQIQSLTHAREALYQLSCIPQLKYAFNCDKEVHMLVY